MKNVILMNTGSPLELKDFLSLFFDGPVYCCAIMIIVAVLTFIMISKSTINLGTILKVYTVVMFFVSLVFVVWIVHKIPKAKTAEMHDTQYRKSQKIQEKRHWQ